MRDGIDEAVVLFVAADFADEEDGVQNHSGDDRGEKNHAEKQQHAFAPIEDGPADSEGYGQGYEGAAQHDEEGDRFSAARDLHGV